MKRVIVLSVLLSAIAAVPAQAQKKDPANTTTGQMQQQRQKEMEDWKAKGEKHLAEQAVVQAKRKDCAAQAKVQKLHLKKRRDFMKQCMG